MTLTSQPRPDTERGVEPPAALARARDIAQPALQSAVSTMDNERMRTIASYQLGWCDADGNPTEGGGKSIRPALALLSAEAVLGSPGCGVPGAVAVELVHNFSLLHDDIMDGDLERRHRPTGWVAFGVGDAILAGNAMLALAVQVLLSSGIEGRRSLPLLMDTTQALISGQSRDLGLEERGSVTLDEVLEMEAGKTAALLACASSIGALSAGAPAHIVSGLATFGHELGMAFQLVDDILGVVGDPAVTGKSSSSDVRAGKRSAPIVAALNSDSPAARRLAELFAGGPPEEEHDIELATSLIGEAGGLGWAERRADEHLNRAYEQLGALDLADTATAQLTAVASYIVTRDR
ncbi:polyprenyl synthetase family protein [Jatrophihabitans sp.]|uniref:polyprenyl synthetase family protein n=1 Tax=Jatrophihabitans sp. TaxID=1932789 RepID=UPI0030C767C2|nr:Geranylgeranyl diphosphate synthase, type [Jatrophihabitans sp.]